MIRFSAELYLDKRNDGEPEEKYFHYEILESRFTCSCFGYDIAQDFSEFEQGLELIKEYLKSEDYPVGNYHVFISGTINFYETNSYESNEVDAEFDFEYIEVNEIPYEVDSQSELVITGDSLWQ